MYSLSVGVGFASDFLKWWLAKEVENPLPSIARGYTSHAPIKLASMCKVKGINPRWKRAY